MSTPASLNTDTIWQALNQVMDPEFGISIVELGLVYSVKLEGSQVDVLMTLTTPSCPAGAMLLDGVRHILSTLPGVCTANVDLVWDPEWSPAMIKPEAKERLGW